MEPLAEVGTSGCWVIALDRPPFGLSERPLQWAEGPAGNPYTAQASSIALT